MAECSKCNADMTGAKLIKKTAEQSKSGKAWAAYVCPSCDNFNFIRSQAAPKGEGAVTHASASIVDFRGNSDQIKLLSETMGRLTKEIQTGFKALQAEMVILKKMIADNPTVIDASEVWNGAEDVKLNTPAKDIAWEE